ncbi:glycerate kinase [Georgenia sp. 10Sc9-8]|uniref:Glycerate kinase n=1 Tax=Georgenia halotolerans TaxID=3028317 RepID=A0ABT5TV30_9MICO|nr:glycerate kinase [Georgenia halotolerans]
MTVADRHHADASTARPPRVLVAPDSFKGSLTAAEVGAHVCAGLRAASARPDCEVLPVADGGEGTLDAAIGAGFEPVHVRAAGPLGEPRATRYARRGDVALVEMAAVSGMDLSGATPQTALAATSRGTGELVRHALDAGARTIVLALGGSASTDGGAGMVRALGGRLSGRVGSLPDGGGALVDLVEVDLSGLDRRLQQVQVVLAGDVDNPLLGPCGAATVYGPQKGTDEATVRTLESGLGRWVDRLHAAGAASARSAAVLSGAGAAGGTGYAAMVLLDAEYRHGIDVVLDLVGFSRRVRGASLVVTGEGSLDEQSLRGKAPLGVARAAAEHGVPVVVVCGRSALTEDQQREAGFRSVYAMTTIEPDVHRCMTEPAPILRHIGTMVARDLSVPEGD